MINKIHSRFISEYPARVDRGPTNASDPRGQRGEKLVKTRGEGEGRIKVVRCNSYFNATLSPVRSSRSGRIFWLKGEA